MARNVTFAPGEYYHVYNRGVEKRLIFSQKVDYDRFLALLYIANSTIPVHLSRQGSTLAEFFEVERGETLVDLGAYCLMPNHFHLLVREKSANGTSKFMQKLITGYTMYFNKRHERTGALFQSRFRATHAQGDEYLKYLLSYIHLNPVKLIDPSWKEAGIRDVKKAQKYLRGYTSSSFPDYAGESRPERKLINPGALPEYFPLPENFTAEMAEWLNFKLAKVQPWQA